jgi:hypothetical protein
VAAGRNQLERGGGGGASGRDGQGRWGVSLRLKAEATDLLGGFRSAQL